MTLPHFLPDFLPGLLPDWAPWWAHLAVVVLALLFGLLFLLMPFSLFGMKGRLDAMDARLDEIQGEIRSLALRLPEPMGHRASDLGYDLHGLGARAAGREGGREAGAPSARPPIPPAPYVPPRRPSVPAERSEPRLY